MNMWVAIVLIVAIVFCADTVNKMTKARAEKKSKKTDSAELTDSLERIEELEERIQVLERIITENKFDLRSEINKLLSIGGFPRFIVSTHLQVEFLADQRFLIICRIEFLAQNVIAAFEFFGIRIIKQVNGVFLVCFNASEVFVNAR